MTILQSHIKILWGRAASRWGFVKVATSFTGIIGFKAPSYKDGFLLKNDALIYPEVVKTL
jgi:hypothetical protein